MRYNESAETKNGDSKWGEFVFLLIFPSTGFNMSESHVARVNRHDRSVKVVEKVP